MKPLRILLIRVVLDRAASFEKRYYRAFERALIESTVEGSFEILKGLMSESLEYRLELERAGRSGELERLSGLRELSGIGGLLQEEAPARAPAPAFQLPGVECGGLPPIDARSCGRHILEAALKRSRCAAGFYSGMYAGARLSTLREVFSSLAAAEARRLERITAQLEICPGMPQSDPDDTRQGGGC